MSGQRHLLATLGFVVSVSLIVSAVSVLFVSRHDCRLLFGTLNGVCSKMVEQEPETKSVISAALKEYTGGNPDGAANEDVLSALGYRVSDFSDLAC